MGKNRPGRPPGLEEARRRLGELSEKLRQYQHEYYILNRPSVSDGEYDRLFDELLEGEARYPELREPDSPTLRVGSDLASELPEVEHTIPVLSLDKAYGAEEITLWMEKIREGLGGQETSFSAEEKIDGISIVLYYKNGRLERGVTRGNGFVGNDVTPNVRTIGSIPLKLSRPETLAVRGEIYLPKSRFKAMNEMMGQVYANPRNLAAGTLRRIKSSESARVPLTAFFYEGFFESGASGTAPQDHRQVLRLLGELGFRVNPRTRFFFPRGAGETLDGSGTEALSVEDFIRAEASERLSLDYEIDGLVFKVNELAPRESLGYTGHHPRWALAFKFESPQGRTVVREIDVQVGRTGRITPVARVEPVSVGGSTISNVTLHNQEYINLLELSLGDTVAVSRRGDVIPAVEKVIEKNENPLPVWRMPAVCPGCGSPLELRGAHHFCPNSHCPAQVRGRLAFFAGKGQMDIENLGPETLDRLVELGLVSSPEDLYTFDPAVLEDQRGFGKKKTALIKEGIEKSRKRPFKTVLASLGIPELGARGAELLITGGEPSAGGAEGFRSMDALLAAADRGDPAAFTGIPGIGETTAAILIRELQRPEMRRRIQGLREAGLCLEAPAEPPRPGGTFAGQTWCVTGSFAAFKPREAAMEEVLKRGGKTVSSVSSKTTHLLAGEGGGSKLVKARELGITVVDEAAFLKLLENQAP
jgi:DNA ligase (NAD+)